MEKEQLLPLITSRDFQLIDGYRRLKLLSALGREEVKVQFVVPSNVGFVFELKTVISF